LEERFQLRRGIDGHDVGGVYRFVEDWMEGMVTGVRVPHITAQIHGPELDGASGSAGGVMCCAMVSIVMDDRRASFISRSRQKEKTCY